MDNLAEMEGILNKAKMGMMQHKDNIFITTVLFSLQFWWEPRIPTAGVDGINLYINPEWFKNMSPKARIGLLAHEAWHPAFDHITRRGTRDPKLWNIAADHVINLMLKADGYELPSGGCWDERFKDMCTDEVYEIIVKEKPPQPPAGGGPGQPGDGDSDGGGMAGDIMEPGSGPADENPDGSPRTSQQRAESMQKAKEAVEDMVVRAATQARMGGQNPGNLPGDVARMLEELLNPKLHWSVIFQNYLTAMAKTDYSYRRPNKRFFPDHYLPSMLGESMGHLAYAVDSSGSVTDAQFGEMRNEMVGGREIANPEKTSIIDFTTEINSIYELSQGENMDDVTFSGYGGTALECVFAHFDEIQPDVLVIFSDMYCNRILDDPGYPVIFIVIDNPNFEPYSFGKVIHFETKNGGY